MKDKIVKVSKVGTSHMVRIPVTVMDYMELEAGSEFSLNILDLDTIILKKVKRESINE